MKQTGEICADGLFDSAIARDINSLNRILKIIELQGTPKMLDLGCSRGYLTRYVADHFKILDVHGVDIEDSHLERAKLAGIHTYNLDLNQARLPFPDGSFNLVTSFGTLEHLVYYDNHLSEGFRVLARDGYLIAAIPNLASYVNRLALFLGYQPRDVEISCEHICGILPCYHGVHLGHIHSATLVALKQLLEYYGFRIVGVNSASPYHQRKLVRTADWVFSPWPSLSRRFIILARKP